MLFVWTVRMVSKVPKIVGSIAVMTVPGSVYKKIPKWSLKRQQASDFCRLEFVYIGFSMKISTILDSLTKKQDACDRRKL